MPKLLVSVLNDMFLKAGVSKDNQAFIDLIQTPELAKVSLPDEIVTNIESNLHTLDSAKSKLYSVIKGEVYNGVDAEIENIMNTKEYGFDDSIKTIVRAEGNSFKRLSLITDKIKELEAQKKGANREDKAETEKQLNVLKAEKAQLQKDYEVKLETEKTTAQARINKLNIQNILSNYKYSLSEGEEIEDKILVANSKLNKRLAESGAKIINNPKNLDELILVAEDGTDFFDKSNNKVNLKTFIEGAIAPILSTRTEQSVNTTQPIINAEQNPWKVNHSASDKVDAEILQALAPPQA